MELTKDLETVLTPKMLKSFSGLFKTEKDYCRILGDLYTIAEYINPLCCYNDSPFANQSSHPIYKIACTLNKMIGALLNINYSPHRIHTEYGDIIVLVKD